MRKIVYTALAGLFVCGAFAGCSQGKDSVKTAKTWEYEEATQIVYDCLGGDGNVMPMLGFWNAPGEAMSNGQYFPDMRNDEYFAAVKEAGINFLLNANDNAVYNDSVPEMIMSYCDQYGIGYYVTDTRLYSADGSFVSDNKTLKQEISRWAEHKSFAGFYIKDEPTRVMEPIINNSLKAFYEVVEETDLNIHPYVTLMPYAWSGFNPDPIREYPKHMDAIYDGTDIPYIQYDIYPALETGFNYEWYYTNMSMVKKAADDKNLSWIPYVSVSDETKYVLPSEGELAWQMNQYLAFGAKGISFFPINTPIGVQSYYKDGETYAMFDWAGNKTKVYYYVKEINKQIAAVDEYLMHATNHGIVVNGEFKGSDYLKYNEVIAEGKFRELKGVSGSNTVVGCFDYYGKTCLYVVNNDMYANGQVCLDFDQRYGYEVTQRGQTANVTGSKIVLNLAAGEAAFVILK